MRALTPYCWRRRVSIRDCDAWGVVWYGNYLAFCDEARAELLRAYGLAPGSFQDAGFVAPVVELQGRYHMPARHDDEIDVHVRLPPAKGTRLRFDFTIRRSTDNELLARISSTLVLVRTNGDLVYLIPDDLKECVSKMMQEQPQEEP